ncbi:MAG: hypothetical protein ACSHYF_17230 [Verrucomicrobiaceae bacterium]
MHHNLIKLSSFAPIAISLGLTSCAKRPIIITTSQVGAHVSGTTTVAPNKSTIGYGRSEGVHLPNGISNGGIVGSLDAEFRNFSGAAITETLITGNAANALTEDGDQQTPADLDNPGITQPSDLIDNLRTSKIISTNTRTNLGIEAAGSDGAGPSFNFGFRRAVAAIFAPPKKDGDENNINVLPSTYADISIHAGGINGNTVQAKSIPNDRQIDNGAIGSRTVQRIATGKAAELLAKQPKTREFVRKQIRGDEAE